MLIVKPSPTRNRSLETVEVDIGADIGAETTKGTSVATAELFIITEGLIIFTDVP